MTCFVGADIGGTFTDRVVLDDQGAARLYKLPTTPAEVARALGELDFTGVALGCSAGELPLEEEWFAPLWQALDDRHAVAPLHGADRIVFGTGYARPASLNGLLQEDLDTHGSQLTWLTPTFMVALVVFEFTFSVLGDLFGRRRLLAAGAALVAVGSTGPVLAPTVQVLWAGAAINGLGAGAMFPGSLTVAAAVTRGWQEKARAIGSVPAHLAGMASTTTNMLRDLGFALGPVVVSTVVLSRASTEFTAKPPGASLPPDQLGAAMGIGRKARPLAVNSFPQGVPGSAAHSSALNTLDSGFGVALAVCGKAAAPAALLTGVGMLGARAPTPADVGALPQPQMA